MDKSVRIIANQLALKFSDDSDIPTRFKKGKEKADKGNKEDKEINLNTLVEKRFQQNIRDWVQVIEVMFARIENKKVLRFITLNPIVEDNISNAVHSKDFSDFTDYLIQRRNQENCDYRELGNLANLYTEFQREIDKRIEEKKSQISIKSLAQGRLK